MTQLLIGLGVGLITGAIWANQVCISFGVGIIVGTLVCNYYKHKALK